MSDNALSPYTPVTIAINFVRGLLSGVAQDASLVHAVMEEAGIADELLHYAGARVTAAQYVTLFRCLCARLDDECVHLLSRPFKRGSYALMAQAALHAPDMQQAIVRVASTLRVLQDDLTLELVREQRLAGLGLHFLTPASERHSFLHEFMLRSLWRLFDWLLGGELTIARFDFAFPTPLESASYSEFFTGPTLFGQPRSVVWFNAAQLQSPVRVDESALRDFLTDPQTKLIVPRRTNDEVSARVLGYLHQVRPAWPDLDATALVLRMSAASLQRNLAKEGTSFQALKDKLRRDMAITYLNTTTMSLGELADKLGFSESAAFQRAFKAWTGSAPGSYRRGDR